MAALPSLFTSLLFTPLCPHLFCPHLFCPHLFCSHLQVFTKADGSVVYPYLFVYELAWCDSLRFIES